MPAPAPAVKAVFDCALEIELPADRAAFLAEACAGHPDVRQKVEALLRAYADAGSFLEPAPVATNATRTFAAAPADPATATFGPGGPAATADYPGRDEQAGTVIGEKYTLIEAIGEGGMGVVWRAKQTDPVKRFVAVKLIKAGMDSKQVLARFEGERQALAMMDHPNIARVLDGGLHDARPFFVMELVKGVPITEFCDERKLTPKERLELFVPVCQAIQHAHQKGIIHRDIKPNNVLIALYDDRPVVKVIDFGVAKATGGTLTEHTIDTGFGGVVGTPQYMSPEQATFNNLDIDTRSDVYALGVLLYELLAGSPPFSKRDMEKRGLLEILRVVREEEPPRPSTKLSTADALPSISANRGTEPKKLTGLLRNELDWIVMKALEKDRSRRYETANGFAADVLRFLAGDPVQAHPPSAAYRMKKFVRRNKGQVIAASLVLFALLAGIAGTTWGLFEARQAKQRESARADGEQKAKDAAVEAQRSAEAAAVAEKAAKEREGAQRARAEKAYARTADVLDTMVSEVTGDSLATQKEISAEQKKFLAEVLTYYQEFAGEKADDENARRRAAMAAGRVGVIEARLDRNEESAAALRTARDRCAALAAEFPDALEYRQNLAGCHGNLGILLNRLGKRAEAEEQSRKAIAVLEKLAAEFPAFVDFRFNMAKSYGNLANVLVDLGKRADAAEQYGKALAIHEKLAAEFPAVADYRYNLAASHQNLGGLLSDQGKRADAEEHFRKGLAIFEKLVAELPTVPEYRWGLAALHFSRGNLLVRVEKRADAEVEYRRASALREKLVAEFPAVPEYRQDLATSYTIIGMLLKEMGRQAESEEQLRKAVTIREKLAADFPAAHDHLRDLANSYNNRGGLLAEMGKHAEAVEQLRKSFPILKKLTTEFPAVTEYRQFLAHSYTNMGALLQGLGKHAEAVEQLRQALALQEKLAAEFPEVTNYRQVLATSHTNLGYLLGNLGKRADAEVQHRKALSIQEKLAAEFPAVLAYQVDLGGSYCKVGNLVRDSGKPAESLEWFDKAIRVLKPVQEKQPWDVETRKLLRNSYAGRANVQDRLRQCAEAIRDWDQAIELSPKGEQPWFRAPRATSRVNAGQVAEAVAEVAELTSSSRWNANQWYDFACVYAVASGKIADKKAEYADRAMALLQQSVKAGWKNASHMQKDTDLDPLREREDFKKLLAELEQKFPPPKEAAPPPREKK